MQAVHHRMCKPTTRVPYTTIIRTYFFTYTTSIIASYSYLQYHHHHYYHFHVILVISGVIITIFRVIHSVNTYKTVLHMNVCTMQTCE